MVTICLALSLTLFASCVLQVFSQNANHIILQHHPSKEMSSRDFQNQDKKNSTPSVNVLNTLQNVLVPLQHAPLRATGVPQGAHTPAPSYWDSPDVFDAKLGINPESVVMNKDTLMREMDALIRSGQVPVVYACVGKVTKFLRYNIEIASRLNPVIVISDSLTEVSMTSPYQSSATHMAQPVYYVPMSLEGISDLQDFPRTYQQIDKSGDSKKFQEFQKNTIIRWLMVCNAVIMFKIPHIFHGDNDVMVMSNLTTALAVRRQAQKCDVIVSMQGDQPDNKHDWLGHLSGHATFWSLGAMIDLRTWWLSVWRDYKDTLKLKGIRPPMSERVGDMNLLFLYWVAHHRNTSNPWDTGRPQSFKTGRLRVSEQVMQEDYRLRFDIKFNQTRDVMRIPNVSDASLWLCNGLDVVDRTCFDHMWAFYSTSFNMNSNASRHELLSHFDHHRHTVSRHQPLHQMVNGSVQLVSSSSSGRVFRDPQVIFLPYIIGLTSYFGGRAESFDPVEVEQLNRSAVYFHAVHYQGGGKLYIPKDGCQRLVTRQQYYLEHYHKQLHRSELEKILSESDDKVEELMLSRIVDPFVREDCREMLKHRDTLRPYVNNWND